MEQRQPKHQYGVQCEREREQAEKEPEEAELELAPEDEAGEE